MALITGISNFWNQALRISVVVLLTHAESIVSYFLVLRTGFYLRKPVIQRFPSNTILCLVAKIRPAKARICVYIGFRPKISWTSTVEGQKASIVLPDCTGYRTP